MIKKKIYIAFWWANSFKNQANVSCRNKARCWWYGVPDWSGSLERLLKRNQGIQVALGDCSFYSVILLYPIFRPSSSLLLVFPRAERISRSWQELRRRGSEGEAATNNLNIWVCSIHLESDYFMKHIRGHACKIYYMRSRNLFHIVVLTGTCSPCLIK